MSTGGARAQEIVGSASIPELSTTLASESATSHVFDILHSDVTNVVINLMGCTWWVKRCGLVLDYRQLGDLRIVDSYLGAHGIHDFTLNCALQAFRCAWKGIYGFALLPGKAL